MKKVLTFLSLTFLIAVLIVVYLLFKENLSPEDQNAAPITNEELKDIGLYDVTTYGADKTGQQDSTTAIQRGMDAAYKDQMVLFFPEGTYLISNTLKALQDRTESRKNAYQLVGSTTGSMPIIKLKANSFNDGNDSNNTVFENGKKKAILHIWTCDFEDKEETKNCTPDYQDQLSNVNSTNGNTAMQMAAAIRNLRFVIESNNPDALAIRYTGNQDNLLSNVVVDAGDGFAGIYGAIGTNAVMQDITVNGGKYGIYGGYGGWGAYTNVKLVNQSELAFTSHSGPHISLSGFEIIKQKAPAIGDPNGFSFSGGNSFQSGTFSLSDGSIQFAESSTEAAISVPSGNQFGISNVYVYKATKLIETDDTTFGGNTTDWSRINVFAHTISNGSGYKLIEGTTSSSDYIPINGIETSNISLPDIYKLRMRHGIPSGTIPSPDHLFILSRTPNSGVINVTDRGAAPLEKVSNTSPEYASTLNQLLSDSRVTTLFFPKGLYPIKNTLTLGKDKQIIGVSNTTSEIITHPSWKPNARTEVIRTINDSNSANILAHMKITFSADNDNNNFDAVHWMAGRKSIIYNNMLRNTAPNRCNSPWGNERMDWWFSSNGGGRAWGLGTGGGACSKYSDKYRGLLVDSTTQPLAIYSLNPEDGHGETVSERNGYMAEIKNAKNVTIRGHKSEDANSVLINNSQNILVLNPGGSVDWSLRENNNILILNTVAKFKLWKDSNGNLTVRKNLIEEEINSNLIKLFKTDEAVSAIARGTIDNSVWDYSSDIDVPTPLPTSNTTPGVTNTPSVTNSPTTTIPSPTPVPSNTPTSAVTGNVCGKADIDGDGRFSIADFAEFAKSYGMGTNTCADKDVDYGVCGGRDVNKDGKLNIADFGGAGIGFAQRYYPKLSCAL